MTSMVTREVLGDGRVRYGIGGSEPLGLDRVADLLSVERDHCYLAFEAFQALVNEQASQISGFEARHPTV